MSGLLTGVVVVLVVCHTPKTFLNIQVTHNTEAFILSAGGNKKTFIGELENMYMSEKLFKHFRNRIMFCVMELWRILLSGARSLSSSAIFS